MTALIEFLAIWGFGFFRSCFSDLGGASSSHVSKLRDILDEDQLSEPEMKQSLFLFQ